MGIKKVKRKKTSKGLSFEVFTIKLFLDSVIGVTKEAMGWSLCFPFQDKYLL